MIIFGFVSLQPEEEWHYADANWFVSLFPRVGSLGSTVGPRDFVGFVSLKY